MPAQRAVSIHRNLIRALLGVLALLVALTLPAPASSQYFGRNKVQYDTFHFEVMKTEHFDIYYYERESPEAVRDFGRMAERWYERYARTFEHAFNQRKPILVYADKADFQQTNAISGFISQGTGGVTESVKDRVILPMGGSYAETDHVLGHELVHAFQFDIVQAQQGGGATGFSRLPTWVVEGMPEYMSIGRMDPNTAMWMRDAVLNDDIPSIHEMGDANKYFPYRYGQALWAYLAGRYGDQIVPELFRGLGRMGLEAGIPRLLGVPMDTLSQEWVESIRSYYQPLLEGRTLPDSVGRKVLSPETGAGKMNVSPALSPDGRQVAFFSQKDLFTIDLYLADAQTGRVLGKLASSGRNPHFDNLFFLSSSGTWSPDGRRFAFVTFAEGNNEIAIVDVNSRDLQRQYHLPNIGAVYSLDWSPDGQTIAFSGSVGGVTDLFLVNVDSGAVTQLTHDRFTQLHPAWSPDGKTIAFATDQGADTNMELLTFSQTGLGFLDRESGQVHVERPLGSAKHINPMWSPDGQSIFFVSDREGFDDIYRFEPGSGAVYQVTRLATGVTGITENSPAITVARRSGTLMFTVYQKGNYIVYERLPRDLGGERVSDIEPSRAAGVLPPPAVQQGENLVAAYLADPRTGLVSAQTFTDRPYHTALRLDYLAQPAVGVAVDRFGTGLGGAIAAYFSDMLGNQELGVAVQAQGGVRDIGGQASYMNRSQRINWGGMVGRIPYRTGFASSGFTNENGQQLQYVDIIYAWTILNRALLAADYPFSETRRIEANVGFTRLGFSAEVFREYYDASGALLRTNKVSPSAAGLALPGGLNLGNATMAYVGDYSFFGFTSPVRGGRYRFEVDQQYGDLTFTNLLGDYRRYFFLNPLTLAFRALHYGRYGKDAESNRLSPLYLGYETLIRGYSVGSFTGGDCTPVASNPSACPEFDRLVGSRLGVANAELRLPLLGTDQFGLFNVSFLPTELSFFADGGVAWTRDSLPDWKWSTTALGRIPVFSTGVSTRFNFFGALVVEVYWAHAFQRERKNHWGFQIAPGW